MPDYIKSTGSLWLIILALIPAICYRKPYYIYYKLEKIGIDCIIFRIMATKNSSKNSSGSTKLYRSEENRMLGGVCGGFSDFFNVDVTLIRILFVIVTVFGGGGLFLYIILWLIVPSKSSLSELSKENFEKNVNEMKDKAHEIAKEIKLNTKRADSKQFFGLVILVFGSLLLLGNFGILNIAKLWRFFPGVVIIILGLAILSKRD